ncbi:hypothetical protein Tco_1071449, partial [Tanacetum coccineum]
SEKILASTWDNLSLGYDLNSTFKKEPNQANQEIGSDEGERELLLKEGESSPRPEAFKTGKEDIESEDSYVSKLDEPDLLVTPLSKLNEDECFDPGGDFVLEEIEACLTSDIIPPGIDDDDFDPEGDILLLEKLLNDDPSSLLPLKELNFEELKEIKFDVSMDFEDDYYDSEGDIIYLKSLLIKDTIHNLPPEVFLDHDPRSLEDEPDNGDLKEIPSGEIKVHIEVLSVLWGNRLPILDGSLPLSRAKMMDLEIGCKSRVEIEGLKTLLKA